MEFSGYNWGFVFAWIAGDGAFEPLMDALFDPTYSNPRVIVSLLRDMKDFRSRAVPLLISTLKDKDPKARRRSAWAIGHLGGGEQQVIESLHTVLEKDEDPAVRGFATVSLGRLGDKEGWEPLVQLLQNNKNLDVREEAAEVLAKMGWKPENEKERTFYLFGKRKWEDLASSIGLPAVDTLKHFLHAEDQDIMPALKAIYAVVDTVVFSDAGFEHLSPRTTWFNPNVSDFPLPLSGLKKIIISVDTYTFQQVEQFMSYAVNHIGQKYLKKRVIVYIYGDPKALQPNLLYSFKNLCKTVIQKKEENLVTKID